MRIEIVLLVSLLWVPLVPRAEVPYPAEVLDNGVLRVVVDVPDPANGRYRGIRFDFSGQILSARYGENEFFGAWSASAEGGLFRDGAGPAEEFSMENPPGYMEAAPGEGFLKIGVGVLQRTDERDYLFHREYPVLSRGEWETKRGDLWVESIHTLTMGRDWGYRYKKKVEIDAEMAVLTIQRTLWNTGKRRIKTDHYSHNFVIPARFIPDERIEMETGISIHPPETVDGAIVLEGKRIRFSGPMPKGGHHVDLFELAGIQEVLEPYHNRGLWRNKETGAELAFSGTHPLRKLVFYGLGRSLSLEPFVPIAVEPGDSVHWRTVYSFRINEADPVGADSAESDLNQGG